MPDRAVSDSSVHPDLADLLLASEGELPKRRQSEVTAHLRQCAACRDQLGSVGFAMREYQDALTAPGAGSQAPEADTRLERLELFRDRLQSEQRAQTTRNRVPFRRWLPIAAAVPVLVAALFFSNRYTSVVRAEELLTRAAAQEESLDARTMRRVEIHLKRTGTRLTRDIGRSSPRIVPAAQSPDETELASRLASSHFDPTDPLSVRGYRAWHDALRVKTDSVTPVGTDALALRTETTDGLLRSAELIVRRIDFQPQRATLTFSDLGDVEIVELSRWTSPAPVIAERPMVTPHKAESPGPSSDALDAAELDVRQTLHRLALDGRSSIAVTRSSQIIEVRGRIDPQHQSDVTQILKALPFVHVALRAGSDATKGVNNSRVDPETSVAVTADGSTSESTVAPPPLQRWLERTFGRSGGSATFVPALLSDATLVRQRVAALATLAERYPESEVNKLAVPSRKKLKLLADEQYLDVIKAIEALDGRLALFIGTSTRSAVTTSTRPWQVSAAAMVPRAERLDQAIRDLLRERDLPLPTDLGADRTEPSSLSRLREAADGLWDELRSSN